MDKWVVYILLAVCLSSCGRGNGNKQICFSNGTIADSIPAEAIRLKIQGNDLVNKGDYNAAMECYTKAIEIYPKYDTVFYNLGNVRSKLDDEKGAISFYTKAIKINANFGLAYYNRADSKRLLNNNIGAINDDATCR